MKNEQTFSRFLLVLLACTALASCKSSDGEGEDPPPADPVTGNSPPAIWGEPATSVVTGSQYLFTPEASDDDGDVLTFSIRNKPGWATFETASGQLRGVPGTDDVGSYEEIVISVTDDNSVVSLAAFSIEVTAEPGQGGDPGDGGEAPSISGDPNEFAVVGTTYAFLPEASDPEGDELSFSITNKPDWASFNTSTGRLEGIPTSANVGQSGPVDLSVTDGTSISALTTFTITVEEMGSAAYTVSWDAPTENEDGTPLTDLAGYRIYYGMISGEYTETIVIDSPGLTEYVLDNLAPGRYFLVMTAINSQDMESRYSGELGLQSST